MNPRKLALFLIATAGVGVACHDQASRAESNLSASIENGSFTIDFPRGWVQPNGESRNSSRSGFLIASSADRVQGVGLPRGNADIIIQKVQGDELGRAADAVERLTLPDEEILSSRNLPVTGQAERDCGHPAEVISLSEMGPGALMTNTYLLCRTDDARFLVLLRYWQGEGRADEYRRVAYDVARSIRVVSD